jgi:hypothetical protein
MRVIEAISYVPNWKRLAFQRKPSASYRFHWWTDIVCVCNKDITVMIWFATDAWKVSADVIR